MGARLSRLVASTSSVVERRLLSWIFGSKRQAALLHGPTEEDGKQALDQPVQDREALDKPIQAGKVDDDAAKRLHAAAKNDDVKTVDALIHAGAELNWLDEDGQTPLYWAAFRGHAEVVDRLLRAGADVNRANNDGKTPLFMASMDDHAAVVDLLLRGGADVNRADKEGSTPLFIASCDGEAEVVDLLLQGGADVNLANETGRTPLYVASRRGLAEVVDLLLRAGADINLLNKRAWSPVHTACRWHTHGALRLLLSWSDSLLLTTGNDGYLPLHLALLEIWARGCTDEALKTLQVLVAYGAAWDETCEKIANQDIDWPSSMGKTPDATRNDLWRETSPAIRLCLERWKLEHEHSLPFTVIPFEEVRNGIDATKTYLTELAASDNVKVRCKICVVGPSSWGKTSLIKSLTQEKPSLVHIDDRTIGIDHFQLKFEQRDEVLQVIKQHEVTFWDFAGQDAYQVAHSLFFSARTLYVVCIDLESFVTACKQAQLLTDTESEFYHWMNDFIEMKVLKWIRVICARQRDAQFVYVATKKDRVGSADLKDPDGALAVLRALLQNVEVIVQEMKSASETSARMREDNSVVNEAAAALPISYLGDPRLAAMVKKPSVRMLVTSCLTIKDVNAFKEQIQDVIVESDRGYPMPDKYSRVLQAVLATRTDTAALATDQRLQSTFITVENLIEKLIDTILQSTEVNQEQGRPTQEPNTEAGAESTVTTVVIGSASDTSTISDKQSQSDEKESYLDKSTCRTILRTLRDLGDVLWYDKIDDEQLRNKIILDPMLMIDLVRQVFNHKRTAEIMTHYTLKELDFWKYLEGTDGMLSMKRVLQHFQLVYPMSGEMQANSDLIVPAYWQSNTCAFWMFGGGDLRFGKGIHREDVAVRVHWEFQFVNNYPGTLFDNVVVASCSASYERDVGPDWIMYMEKDKYACRLVLKRAVYTHHWILHLEAIQSHTANDEDKEYLWDCFMLLSMSLERVIHGYPGVVVTRYARPDTQGEVVEAAKTLDSLRQSSKLSVRSRKWMPPQKAWAEYLAYMDTAH